MSLFLGPMLQHIPGRKSLTEHSEAKVLMPDKTVYIPVSPSENAVEFFVKEGDHVDIGTKLYVPKQGFVVPVYSSVSGTYTGLAKRPHSSMKPMQHMTIELDAQQKEIQAFPPIDWTKASQSELVEQIKTAGIIGQGGAGFPTYVKYLKPEGINTLLINAVECEPFITADYRAILDNVQDFVLGCQILKKTAGAQSCLICIKKSHPDLIDFVQKELERLNVKDQLAIYPVPDVYPMGGERTLIRTVLKREYDRLPSECGVIVNNAYTAILVCRACRDGSAISKKYVTVSGNDLKNPTNVIVPVGMVSQEILDKVGGFETGLETSRLIAGGPMMGKAMVNANFVIDRAMNALTCLKVVDNPSMTCMRCGKCTAHCPIGLQPVRIQAAVTVNDVEAMEKRGALSCIECGLCTYVCPSKIQVTENVRKAKRTLMMKKK